MPPESQTRQRQPCGAGAEVASNCRPAGHPHDTTAEPLSLLIGRLENVRGNRADCPCGHKARGTLAFKSAEDGTVYLKCHAGCAAADVLAAIGLELRDLFPRRMPDRHLSRDERRALAGETRITRTWAALGAVLPDLALVEVGGRMAVAGELTADDANKIATAVDHVHAVRIAVQEVAR